MPVDNVLPSFLVNAYGDIRGSPPPVTQPGLVAMPPLKSKSKVVFGADGGGGSRGGGGRDGGACGGSGGDGGDRGGAGGDGGGGDDGGGDGDGRSGGGRGGDGGGEGGNDGGDGGDCGGRGGAAPQLTVTCATAASPLKSLPHVYSKANDGE